MVVEQRAPVADEAPVAVPGGGAALGAPAPAVGEDHALRHLEDAARGVVALGPRAVGVELVGVDRDGIHSAQVAGQVEVVDGHVQDQRAFHLVAEAPEVAAEVEVAVDRRDRADLAGRHHPPHPLVPRVPAAGLADHVHPARRLGRLDHPPRLGHARGHGLLADHVAARRQGRAGDRTVGLGNGEVDDEVRANIGQRGLEVRRGGAVQIVLGDSRLGGLDVQVHHADDLDLLGLQRREPRPGDPPRPDDHCTLASHVLLLCRSRITRCRSRVAASWVAAATTRQAYRRPCGMQAPRPGKP